MLRSQNYGVGWLNCSLSGPDIFFYVVLNCNSINYITQVYFLSPAGFQEGVANKGYESKVGRQRGRGNSFFLFLDSSVRIAQH